MSFGFYRDSDMSLYMMSQTILVGMMSKTSVIVLYEYFTWGPNTHFLPVYLVWWLWFIVGFLCYAYLSCVSVWSFIYQGCTTFHPCSWYSDFDSICFVLCLLSEYFSQWIYGLNLFGTYLFIWIFWYRMFQLIHQLSCHPYWFFCHWYEGHSCFI